MSAKSNDNGRAFEYACIMTLYHEIRKTRNAEVVTNSSLIAAATAWKKLNESDKLIYRSSAAAIIPTVFELEPNILEDEDDLLQLYIQKDETGEDGDVRDIIISRQEVQWQVGFSMKHNHFAVKHSRLSPKIDFGAKWYGMPCSQNYWNDVRPVYAYLSRMENANVNFEDLPDKINDVYVPILNAFRNELQRHYEQNPDLPKKMVEYLLGKFDFYKVISIDIQRETLIEPFNMHGQLNRPSKTKTAAIAVPVVELPTQILAIAPMKGRANTLAMCMDNGWQFTFRIHNAEKLSKPTLKFDIQIVGMPTAILRINCKWK